MPKNKVFQKKDKDKLEAYEKDKEEKDKMCEHIRQKFEEMWDEIWAMLGVIDVDKKKKNEK